MLAHPFDMEGLTYSNYVTERLQGFCTSLSMPNLRQMECSFLGESAKERQSFHLAYFELEAKLRTW